MLFLLKDPFKKLLGSKQAVTAYDTTPSPSEFQAPGNIKSPTAHTVNAAYFLSRPFSKQSYLHNRSQLCSAGSLVPASSLPPAVPDPLPHALTGLSHTDTSGRRRQSLREKDLFTHKELKE